METQDIKDFSDLGQSVMFKYKGTSFAIPPLTRSTMTALLRMNQKISDSVKKKPGEEEKDSSFNEETVQGMDSLFELQQEFVLMGIRKVSPDGSFSLVDKSEVDLWPMRLTNNVIRMINEALTTTTDRGDERPT